MICSNVAERLDPMCASISLTNPRQAAEQAGSPEERTDPAEHPDERMVRARQRDALSEDRAEGAACTRSEEVSADLAALYCARPSDFHGISAQSAYWPQIKRLGMQPVATVVPAGRRRLPPS